MLRALELFRVYPQALSVYEHVLVDEFQDTNELQFKIVKLMESVIHNITVVGDPDQSIYGYSILTYAKCYSKKKKK